MKVQVWFAFVVLSCTSVSYGQQEQKNEHEKKVMAGIADLTLLRDDVQKRFAVFIVGEQHRTVNPRPPVLTELFMFRAASRPKSFSLIVNGRMLQRRDGSPLSGGQHWAEFVKEGHNVKVRAIGFTGDAYIVKPKGLEVTEFVDRSIRRLNYLEPFDDLVIHPMFFLNPIPHDNAIEGTYLKHSKLLSVDLGVQGTLLSNWQYDEGMRHYDIQLTQAAAFDYMPIEVKFTSRMPKMGDNSGHTRIQWRKVDGFDRYLPYRVEAAYAGIGQGVMTELFFRFHWKVGDQVPEEVFDFHSQDNRLAIGKLFGDFQFDTWHPQLGLVLGTAFETVSDLFEDESK